MTEAYIIGGVRTPIGRYGGALSTARPDDLAAHVIREALARVARLPAEEIDEVVLGCANQAGEDNRNVARMAALLAGLPDTVPGTTINRLCGSGLDAVGYAARAIRLGEADIIIAGGVESMSRAPFVLPKAISPFQRGSEIHDTTIGWRFVNPLMEAAHGIDSMPETAENVAADFAISRTDQDAFAARSQARAAAAQKIGRFAREIAPYPIQGRKGETTLVEHDEHPRETTIEKLASLPTPFRVNGTVTAGNASGVNDGAAALILASARAVERYNLQPLARVDGLATAGVAPRIMGIGPVSSTRKLLDRHGLGVTDIDIIELNEAFAAQALACLRELGLPDDATYVNPNGGAIALGHPLGMSGARLALTAALELDLRGARRALATMCIGVGQGISLLLTRP
ncbi:3-oxoadipyl-CoA thiolase (plasmid) [Sinorhizobium medicae]|uniref:3-oxoadipyl-CoA thiolase n=1 Tax=Sinorhizobium medicae TaxID=110321 RepID=UPI000C9C2AE7|nr:3-oxoadipyl-CoA thiolase [Sinorhizobium medicae]MBO1965550.1 3-oxoadipyl-CoA thiolase [Sinorhizobium medicae]PND17936.1 3-oxoadipyl-CoA thiolase [Ensifer sp. MMN_5]RVJ76514.1 3-oxoadipyl-CoA thiolase [Sinorhizobium medicae]WQO54958.1 3-oxoadipyl-CoA thiolase [Sinorhizobium medicae]